MNNILVIHPHDTITRAEYNGLESLQENVGGYIELGGIRQFKIANRNVEVTFYCDEEFLLKNDNKFCLVNALASSLVKNIIYGNVVIIPVNENGENVPFSDKDATEMEKQLAKYKTENAKELKNLHNLRDGVIRL